MGFGLAVCQLTIGAVVRRNDNHVLVCGETASIICCVAIVPELESTTVNPEHDGLEDTTCLRSCWGEDIDSKTVLRLLWRRCVERCDREIAAQFWVVELLVLCQSWTFLF